jgi:hypothetical protein
VPEKRRIRAISYRVVTCQSDCRRDEKGAARLHLHLVAAVSRALPNLHYNCDDQNIDDVHNIFDL